MDERLSETFISWPERDFFLKHLVITNYAGKVYSVLRGIEVVSEVEGVHKVLYITYAVCMALGMFWYTRFWLGDDIDRFYSPSPLQPHALKKFGVRLILSGAAVYYLIFGVLFGISFSVNEHRTALSLTIWNFWCFLQLLLAL